MDNTFLIINSLCSIAVAVIVLVAMIKGWISADTASAIAGLLDTLKGNTSGVVADLASYAAIAVRAVEQMVKTGEIKKDNAIRQKAAVEKVRELAVMDYDEEDVESIDYETIAAIVDAEVNKLPRNN